MTWHQDGWCDGADVRDLERIVSAFRRAGIEIDRFSACCAWCMRSEELFANWLSLNSHSDEEIVSKCLPYLKDVEVPDGQ